MPNSEGRSILAVPSRLTRPPSRSSSWPSRATRPKAAPPKSGPKPSPTFISSSLNAYLPREIASYTKNLTVSEPRSRFTLLFERFAIDVLHETDVLGAARILAITWDEAHGVMARAVARGLLRREHTVPEYVGLDEKSIARGQTYATIACDLTDGHVIDVSPERT